MSIMVEKEVGEPIITFTVEGYVSDEEVTNAYLRSLEIAQTIEGIVYRIIDLRAVSNPIAVIRSIKSIVMGLAGAAVEPTMRISFVCASTITEAVSNMNITHFEDMNEAFFHYQETTGSGIVAL